jgi:hypothetical protein
MDPTVRPTVTRSNEVLLRIVREYQAGDRDSAAQIDVGHVPVLNRPSPAATRPAGMATRSAAVTGILSADPSSLGFFTLPPRVFVGEGGGNGDRCTGL